MAKRRSYARTVRYVQDKIRERLKSFVGQKADESILRNTKKILDSFADQMEKKGAKVVSCQVVGNEIVVNMEVPAGFVF